MEAEISMGMQKVTFLLLSVTLDHSLIQEAGRGRGGGGAGPRG